MHPRFECFHNGNYQMLKGRLMYLICQKYKSKSKLQLQPSGSVARCGVFDMSKVYNYS